LAFLRVAEFFPPLFRKSDHHIDLEKGVSDFVRRIEEVRGLFDVALVGDHKNADLLKFSSVQAAAKLEEVGLESAPVIVARDSNGPQVLSAVLTALGLGLRNLMLAWGDRYPAAGPRNVYDFTDLAELVGEARRMAAEAGISARIFAPVDIESLRAPEGIRKAAGRLEAGADLLLAQPPTTDAEAELARHTRILESARLKDRVLLNAFPFRGREDLLRAEEFFGWALPDSAHRRAESGEDVLASASRDLAGELRRLGFPGVYVSTRGYPEVLRRILG
jgi:5,10-methylenetetrahydrofolate reductase